MLRTTCLTTLALLLAGTSTRATTANDLETTAIDLVISAEKPLSSKKKELRTAVVELCKRMLEAPAGEFEAHPSAACFPGAVAKTADRLSRTVTMRHVPPDDTMLRLIEPLRYSNPFAPTWYSTGLYAAPGETVTVEIPNPLTGKLKVQIGCHSDRLDRWVAAKQDWRRMPLLVNSRPLNSTRTQISNPFGGLIYITCPPKTEAWQGDVTISNAVMAPLFVLGQTTDQQWKEMVETTGAPWGEMATENVIIMLPTSVLKRIPNPTVRMRIWDRVVGSIMDLAQLPMPFYRAQRLVTDVHMGGGFMHSGYPIMVHHCPEKGLNTEEFISDPQQFTQPANGGPNWGFFHEIGHNMQNLDWVFDGTTEVSVNFFSLYCFDKIVGGRDAAHHGVSNEFTRKALKNFFSREPDLKKWKSDPFLALITFRLIQNDFGWELFKESFRRYHELDAQDRPRTDAEKRDCFVRYFSESAQRNFAPYFATWGIPLSEELRNDLAAFPVWMPYNFPPASDGGMTDKGY